MPQRDTARRTAATLALVALALGAAAPAPPRVAGRGEEPRIVGEFGLDDEAADRLAVARRRLEEHEVAKKPDPIEANGPLFVDWPTPDAALVFTGEQDGYLEPCGCAGLENQKGGLKRRFTLLRTLRDEWLWPVAAMDAGEQVRYFGPQAQIKFRQSIESLVEMGYAAVGFGARDLQTDALGVAINLDEASNPLTSANVALLDFDSGLSRRWRLVTLGGDDPVRVAVTAVTSDGALAEVGPNGDLTTLPADEALAGVVPEIVAAGADQNVLLVYGDRAEAEQLAKKHDVFDWVVAARGSDEPPASERRIEGTTRGGGTRLVEVGHKGMYAIVAGLYRKPKSSGGGEWFVRYQKTPLDHRWADAPEMTAKQAAYQDELRTLGWEGLGLRPAPHPTEREFAGSGACADCHTAAWEVFEKTPHSWTTETLVALQPARHFDPECIACHATGWEPQKYYPFQSGWLGYRETPHLAGNGCENCHGPAARHAAIESGEVDAPEAEQQALRAALHLEVGQNEGNMPGQRLGDAVNNCLQCHDLDNSPDFDFQKYWPKVAHKGLD